MGQLNQQWLDSQIRRHLMSFAVNADNDFNRKQMLRLVAEHDKKVNRCFTIKFKRAKGEPKAFRLV